MARGVRWLIILLVAACTRVEEPSREVSITLLAPEPHTRSGDPEESLIADYNLFVFNSFICSGLSPGSARRSCFNGKHRILRVCTLYVDP